MVLLLRPHGEAGKQQRGSRIKIEPQIRPRCKVFSIESSLPPFLPTTVRDECRGADRSFCEWRGTANTISRVQTASSSLQARFKRGRLQRIIDFNNVSFTWIMICLDPNRVRGPGRRVWIVLPVIDGFLWTGHHAADSARASRTNYVGIAVVSSK